MTSIIKKTGDLDLIYDNDFDSLLKQKDEIGELSKAFNNIRNEFVIFIKQTLENSKDMKVGSEKLAYTVEEPTIKAENIETIVGNIANRRWKNSR